MCTLYLKDAGAECAAYIKGCTPGARFTDQAKADALQQLVAAVSFHHSVPTVVFTGVNVQIVSGSGATDGPVNGAGNLIVGYDKGTLGQTRTGSHNLVVGDEHEYTSYGGFVAGLTNTVSGPSASVTGGYENVASGMSACVIGGHANTASGLYASVSGGLYNIASGADASVSGGALNTASGLYASVSGGNSLTQPADNGWAAGSVEPNAIVGNFESP